MNKIILLIFFSLAVGAYPLQTIYAADFKERIYLQTDKNAYLSGETVWMKVVTTDINGIPVDFSKVAYIELLGENQVYQQTKIEIRNASAEGWLEIPVTLATGYYRMIAYTNYMKNEGESAFLKKDIAVINPFQKLEIYSQDSQEIPSANLSVLKNENKLSVTAAKDTYRRREKGTVHLQNLPANLLTLSISISGKNDYFNSTPEELTAVKDMVSHPFLQSGSFMPEYEGHIITGKLINTETGKMESNSNVSSFLAIPDSQFRIFGGKTDADGTVRFVTRNINGFRQMITTVLDQSGKKKYRIDLQSPFIAHSAVHFQPLLIPKEYEEDILLRSIGLQSAQLYWRDSIFSFCEPSNSSFLWQADESYLLDNYTRFPTMKEVIVEIIPSLRFREVGGKMLLSIYTPATGFNAGATLLMLDGMPLAEYEEIFNYNPALVKQIDVYKSSFVFSGNYYAGMVNFHTQNNNLANYRMNSSTQYLSYEAPQLRRSFFVPDYSTGKAEKSTLPDLRHTLLWNPFLPVDQSSLEIPFFTSDYPGKFEIIVEGITNTGEVISGIGDFVVE